MFCRWQRVTNRRCLPSYVDGFSWVYKWAMCWVARRWLYLNKGFTSWWRRPWRYDYFAWRPLDWLWRKRLPLKCIRNGSCVIKKLARCYWCEERRNCEVTACRHYHKVHADRCIWWTKRRSPRLALNGKLLIPAKLEAPNQRRLLLLVRCSIWWRFYFRLGVNSTDDASMQKILAWRSNTFLIYRPTTMCETRAKPTRLVKLCQFQGSRRLSVEWLGDTNSQPRVEKIDHKYMFNDREPRWTELKARDERNWHALSLWHAHRLRIIKTITVI